MANFMQGLKGLLDSGMIGDIGTGLLANSGWSTMPQSFGAAAGNAMQYANQRQAQRIEMDAMRQAMEQKQRQQEAMEQLQGLLSPGTTPAPVKVPTAAPITTPEGRQQAIGLLGQISPEAVSQGLLSQMFAKEDPERVPADLRTFKTLYPQLQEGTPEFAQGFMDFVQKKDETGALQDQAQLELLTQQLAAAREERAAKQETAAQERSTLVRAVNQDLRHLSEMAELNKRLDGTALETGLPLADIRRAAVGGAQALQSLLGNDTSKAEAIKADFDRLSKLTTDFVVGSLDRLAGSGAITDTKFQALVNSNASMGASPTANNLIIADNIDALLDGAEVEGISIAEASKLRSLAESLRGSRGSSPNPQASSLLDSSSTAVDPQLDAMQKMLDQLDAQIKAMEGK